MIPEAFGWPQTAFNSTYNLQVYSEEIFDAVNGNLTGPGGCLDSTLQCRAAAVAGDPYNYGNNDTVNALCAEAAVICFVSPLVQGAFVAFTDV